MSKGSIRDSLKDIPLLGLVLRWFWSFAGLAHTKTHLYSELDKLRNELDNLRKQFHAEKEQEQIQSQLPAAVYWSLETRLRGDREDIRDRLSVYKSFLKLIEPLELPAVDLGCGRGEMLEIFERANLASLGIDSNAHMVKECEAKGLVALQANLIHWLGEQESNSLSLVSAIHVIEHLKPGDFWSLIASAHRVLSPGGILVLETPNPENIQVASKSFWLDPSHRAPIPPQLLEELVRIAGFNCIETLRLAPVKNQVAPIQTPEPLQDKQTLLDQLLFGSQDYALVCQKPS